MCVYILLYDDSTHARYRLFLGGETPSYFDYCSNNKDSFEVAAKKLPNNFPINSGRGRSTNTRVTQPNNLSVNNTNAMNTMTTQSSSQSHLYLREDNLTRNKQHSTHIHNHNTMMTDMSSSKDGGSSQNMYSISSHSSYGTRPGSNPKSHTDTLLHPNNNHNRNTSNSNSNSVESLGSTMYFVPTRNISADYCGKIYIYTLEYIYTYIHTYIYHFRGYFSWES